MGMPVVRHIIAWAVGGLMIKCNGKIKGTLLRSFLIIMSLYCKKVNIVQVFYSITLLFCGCKYYNLFKQAACVQTMMKEELYYGREQINR